MVKRRFLSPETGTPSQITDVCGKPEFLFRLIAVEPNNVFPVIYSHRINPIRSNSRFCLLETLDSPK